MKFLPTEVWIVKGKGESNTSKINTWDRALKDAGIFNHNFVEYTSILPKNVKFRDFRKELIPGQEVKFAIAVEYGNKGERITAGLILGLSDSYGLIGEFAGKFSEIFVRRKLKEIMSEMVKDRKIKIRKTKNTTKSLEVKKNFGCVFVAIIYNPNTYK